MRDSSLLGDNLVVLPPAIAQMVGLRVGVKVGLRVCCCRVKLGIVITKSMSGRTTPSICDERKSRPFSCSAADKKPPLLLFA